MHLGEYRCFNYFCVVDTILVDNRSVDLGQHLGGCMAHVTLDGFQVASTTKLGSGSAMAETVKVYHRQSGSNAEMLKAAGHKFLLQRIPVFLAEDQIVIVVVITINGFVDILCYF